MSTSVVLTNLSSSRLVTDAKAGVNSVTSSAVRVQPPVMFPIGGHVNVLHGYKKTKP